MATRTNKLTKSGVPRKVRSDKLMPDTLVACRDCRFMIPHALLSKAGLCRACACDRMIKVFDLMWLYKRVTYDDWQATRQKSKQKGGNNDTKT